MAATYTAERTIELRADTAETPSNDGDTLFLTVEYSSRLGRQVVVPNFGIPKHGSVTVVITPTFLS